MEASVPQSGVGNVCPVAAVRNTVVDVKLDHVIGTIGSTVGNVLCDVAVPVAVTFDTLSHAAAISSGVTSNSLHTSVKAVIFGSLSEGIRPLEGRELLLTVEGSCSFSPGTNAFVGHKPGLSRLGQDSSTGLKELHLVSHLLSEG